MIPECPQHEFNEEDFQRIFGNGDERDEQQASIYADWDDSGHGRGDFA